MVTHPYYILCEFQTYRRFLSLRQLLALLFQWCLLLPFLHPPPLEIIHFRALLLSPFSCCFYSKEFALIISYKDNEHPIPHISKDADTLPVGCLEIQTLTWLLCIHLFIN